MKFRFQEKCDALPQCDIISMIPHQQCDIISMIPHQDKFSRKVLKKVVPRKTTTINTFSAALILCHMFLF